MFDKWYCELKPQAFCVCILVLSPMTPVKRNWTISEAEAPNKKTKQKQIGLARRS